MKSVHLSIEQIHDLQCKGLLFDALFDASNVAQNENMFYRTNDYAVFRVVHKWTDDEYGFTVLKRS
ncbi:MAG: hypothetical protein J6R22_00230 [Alphaproteobacteria bacterium]|nr:hypothetical protein [Alphaproteobacteria bacterium]